ncbi:MAG: hypothetical protein R3C10_18430 [Pirellulales bacterium]
MFVLFQNVAGISGSSLWNRLGITPNLAADDHDFFETAHMFREIVRTETPWDELKAWFSDMSGVDQGYFAISTLVSVCFVCGIWCTVHAALLGAGKVAVLLSTRTMRLLRGRRLSLTAN